MTALSHRTGPYIPRKHEKFRRWAFVFTERIRRDPASVKLNEQTALQLAAQFALFNEAYDIAVAPSTRTTITVRKMNAARKVLEAQCRTHAQRIKKDPEIPDTVKCDLYLHIDRKPRGEIKAVHTQPVLKISGALSGRHQLLWGDTRNTHMRRKPKDAAAMQLFAVVADRQVPDPGMASYVGTYTRQPIKVRWPSETAGKTITYFGRWITANGREGPWSLPMSMQIAFGGPALDAIEKIRVPVMNVQPIKGVR